MKVLFVESKKINFEKVKDIGKLPKRIHVLYIIQYKNLAKKIKNMLEENGHHIASFEQVLGCSKIKPKAEILLIGSGGFHASQIALQTSRDVFIYQNGRISKIKKEDIEKLKAKKKAKIAKFYSSNTIGLLVSSKPGQPSFRTVTLPAGSVIEVRTTERISSKTNVTGDTFGATLTQDLSRDGETLFRRGSEVEGRLIEVIRPGKVKGRASITFDLHRIGNPERLYELETNSITLEAESSKGKDAAKVGAIITKNVKKLDWNVAEVSWENDSIP